MKTIGMVSVFASALLLGSCGGESMDKTQSKEQVFAHEQFADSAYSQSSAVFSSSNQLSLVLPPSSDYDSKSLLGLKVGENLIFPISMTLIDHNDKTITVKVATRIGAERSFDEKSLVVILNGDQVYLDQDSADPQLFSVPISLARSMVSAKPSVIQFHVEKDRYYEANFELIFENSFRSVLVDLLKSK